MITNSIQSTLPSDRLYAPADATVAISVKKIFLPQPKHSVSSINNVADEDIQRMLLERRSAPAFELLVERYQQKVFRLAYSIIGDSASAEDVTQDAFVKMWQVLPEYDGRASLSTLLYTIVRNTALSALRAATHRRSASLDCSCEVPAPSVDTVAQLETEKLVGRLPEAEQEVVRLFYLQDRNVDEVAQMLDMPIGTVKSHLHRARRRLAEWMK
jgi:RNA polymerase sigma-70 factor (ECF subfamily)